MNLSADIEEGPTIHPALLDRSLRLSHAFPSSGAIDRTGGGSAIEVDDALSGRVMWNVEAIQLGTMNWTIFPSTGLLLPGERRVGVGARHCRTRATMMEVDNFN